MYGEIFTVFLRNEGMGTVRTAQGVLLRKSVFLRIKGGSTHFAADLTFGAIVFIEIRHRGITAGASTILADIAFRTSSDRSDDLPVTQFVVFQKPLVLNGFIMDYHGKDIGFKFLVFRRMTVIKSPLLKRNIFSDKK